MDGKLTLNECRAIIRYIANKYDTTGKLYPTDIETRARIDQRLSFDSVLYLAFSNYAYPLLFWKCERRAGTKERFMEVAGWLNDYCKENYYVAGTDNLSIADLALAATL